MLTENFDCSGVARLGDVIASDASIGARVVLDEGLDDEGAGLGEAVLVGRLEGSRVLVFRSALKHRLTMSRMQLSADSVDRTRPPPASPIPSPKRPRALSLQAPKGTNRRDAGHCRRGADGRNLSAPPTNQSQPSARLRSGSVRRSAPPTAASALPAP